MLTELINWWAELPSFNRGLYSFIISLLIYIAFRLFIRQVNKAIAENTTPRKEKGNYRERLIKRLEN